MSTFRQLIEAIQNGHKPVVSFGQGILEFDDYVEPGMVARVIDARVTHDNMCRITFDFAEFDERNRPLEQANYYGVDGGPMRTAREAGYYKAQDDLPFMLADEVSPYFEIESDARQALFKRFVDSNPGCSYVAWLENQVLALKD